MATVTSDRFVRQQELVPAERLAELSVTVIGVGSIGRQVARTLAAIGVRRMQLVDFDRVENGNRTTQGYLVDDVGQAKVVAMAREIARLDPSIDIELVEDRYRPKLAVGEAVFCCVDSIETRASIWRTVGPRAEYRVPENGCHDGCLLRLSCINELPTHYQTISDSPNGWRVGTWCQH